MADVLQTPAECLFFGDLLPQVPAETRAAVAIGLARALHGHGMAADEWRTNAGVPAFLNELCRQTGAVWLPAVMTPVLDASPPAELADALARRQQIAGRTAADLLAEAESYSATRRMAMVRLVEDAICAGQITGTSTEDDVRVARAGVRLLIATSITWGAATPEVEAVEAECRAVRAGNAGHAQARLLLGRALLQRSVMSNDRDAVPLLREAVELLGAEDGDAARAVWPFARACARLGFRSVKSEALRLLDTAEATLAKLERPDDLQSARARIEVLLARTNFEDETAAGRRFQEALDLAEDLIVRQAGDPDTMLLRAQILARRAERAQAAEAEKGLEEAGRILQDVLSLDPGNYIAHVHWGYVRRAVAESRPASKSQEVWEEARKAFQRAAAMDGGRPEAYAGLLAVEMGKAAHDRGGPRAQEAWEAVVLEIPRFDGFALFRRRLGGVRLAQAMQRNGPTETDLGMEAIQHFEAAAALTPSDPVTIENWGHALLQQGGRAESQALLAGAIAKFEHALEVRPGYKWALSSWGDALAATDTGLVKTQIAGYEAAISKYDEALQVDPTFRPALMGRASVKTRLSWLKPDGAALVLLVQAEGDAEACVQADSEDWRVYRVLGHLHYARAEHVDAEEASKRLDRALESYGRAAELTAGEFDLYNSQGDVYRAKARRSGRRELLDEALAAYRSVPEDAGRAFAVALMGIGYCLLERTFGEPRYTAEETAAVAGRLEEARSTFDRALAAAPELYYARRGMATTLRHMAELKPETAASLLDEAERHAQDALKLRPDDRLLLTLLGDVYYAQATVTKVGDDVKSISLAKAYQEYLAALVMQPDHFWAQFGAGRTAMALSEIGAKRENASMRGDAVMRGDATVLPMGRDLFGALDRSERATMASSGIGAERELLREAAEHFERALTVRPDDRAAQRELNEARDRLANRKYGMEEKRLAE